MAYTYSNGDGVTPLLVTEPNGATEPISNLDNAIRQIKAYLNDPTEGPEGKFSGILGDTKVIATQNTSQTLAAGAGIATIAFNVEDLDAGADYNNTTYTFTAPAAGLYLAVVSVTLDVTASSTPTDIKYQLDIFVDGTSGARTTMNMGTNENNQDLSLVRLFNLSAGQTLLAKLTVTVGSGSMTVTLLNDPRETVFQVVKQPVLPV